MKIKELIYMEQLKKIKELSRPLIEYLQQNYNPYTSIIIESDRIKVVEDLMYIPIFYNERGKIDWK